MKMTNIKMSFLTLILSIYFASPLSASVNLSVLLTNDDGINSPGLKALSKNYATLATGSQWWLPLINKAGVV